ncbi:hypothetical protein SUDANB99_05948 (plasmid) [Streptomyces sp. enrichment culture]
MGVSWGLRNNHARSCAKAKLVARLKQWRGIATRYDKTAESYEAAVVLASLLMWA